MESVPCLKTTPFGHDSKENRTPVPENHPFRARLQRAPSACTSGMKSHCCTLQNYLNPNIHTVILSVARDPHETACTFVVKLHQVPGGRQQSSARTALAPSRPERLTCSRRIPYIPATVPRGMHHSTTVTISAGKLQRWSRKPHQNALKTHHRNK